MLFCLGKPKLNPETGKALQIPILNPFDTHGRVFFAAWTSFFISFLAWYSLPPLLTRTIKVDLLLTTSDVLNSNIVALSAGTIVRLIAGPLCDIYSPRSVLIGIVFLAALPTGLAGVINTVDELYAIRFLIGIAGGSFVPAAKWLVDFYDPSIIGLVSGMGAGFGDAGVGVTFFLMPAVFEAILQNHTETFAWRLSFSVPALLLLISGIFCLLLCDDLPKIPTQLMEQDGKSMQLSDFKEKDQEVDLSRYPSNSNTLNGDEPIRTRFPSSASSATLASPELVTPIKSKPGFRRIIQLLFSLQTLLVVLPYAASFGAALVINASLATWYTRKFGWDSDLAGSWAASFGLLNFVTRPAGGMLSDVLAKMFPNAKLQGRKYWLITLIVLQGVFCLWIGLVDSEDSVTLIVGITFLAVFIEMANGACYALLPFINSEIVGTLGGFVGAMGNLAGILFSVVFRFENENYANGFWIIGVLSLGAGCSIVLISPDPKVPKELPREVKEISVV